MFSCLKTHCADPSDRQKSESGKKILSVLLIISCCLILAPTRSAHASGQEHEQEQTSADSKKNRLASVPSPYLQQHAGNPVDWYPWGPEAIKKARNENKMIIVSVGYATCYWCFVMEKNVFSQDDVAKVMNENYVNIKVDREIRPDIDEIMMKASSYVRGQTGWPNHIIMTPELRPVFAHGTMNKAQWLYVLNETQNLWNTERQRVRKQAAWVNAAVKKSLQIPSREISSFDAMALKQTQFDSLKMHFDNRHGGFGPGQKAHNIANMMFLIEQYRQNNDKDAEKIITKTFDHMIAGGIHDHIEGGFHRYTSDPAWNIPHFEKMLYDQGFIMKSLADFYTHKPLPRYQATLKELQLFVKDNMTGENKLFYSAIDAKADEIEGAYYVWSRPELESLLTTEELAAFDQYFTTTDLYHFPDPQYPEGQVLHLKMDDKDKAKQKISAKTIKAIKDKLRSQRQKRTKPFKDQKAILAWNAIMIHGMAHAGLAMDDETFIRQAKDAAQAVETHFKDPSSDKMYRIYFQDQAHQSAFLDDYAWWGRGLVSLFKATGEEHYRNKAIALLDTIDRLFLHERSGSYYYTDTSNLLSIRIRQGKDSGILPGSNAVMAHLLIDLYEITQDVSWLEQAKTLTKIFAHDMMAAPLEHSFMIAALMRINDYENSSLPTGDDRFSTGPKNPDVMGAVPVNKTSKKEVTLVTSKDKVSVYAYVKEPEAPPKTKKKSQNVAIIIEMEDGWHINANTASLDFLVPTMVDVQTPENIETEITYPEPDTFTTELGTIEIYEGTTEIEALIQDGSPLQSDTTRILIQLQACRGEICYPPSTIAVPFTALQ